ncbi:MAG: hypothetical protein IPK31_00970 [Chitinophagaceae bacterium]|nr:hypothetical protein [Chitinophagaceae bacterium]
MKEGAKSITTETETVKKNKSLPQLSTYTIENVNGTRLIVSNLGAIVISLFVKDKDGKLADVVLGYDTQPDYQADEFYLGSVVGRYANRIAGSTIVLDDATYNLPVKEGAIIYMAVWKGLIKSIFCPPLDQRFGNRNCIYLYKSSPGRRVSR